jgi:hypothetical protein
MRRWLCLGLLAATLPARTAGAEAPDDVEDTVPPPRPGITHDLLDPGGHTRFHLTTRVTPSGPEGTFSNDVRLTMVARAHVQVTEGLALHLALPFGAALTEPGPDAYSVGNIRLGVEGGRPVYLGQSAGDSTTPRLNLGGAFDVYLPTAAAAKNDFCLGLDVCDAVALVRDLHAYEPESFTDDVMFVKGRLHADVSASVFTAGLELGFSPGLTLDSDPEFLFLVSWVARGAVAVGPYLEPFLELGSTLHLVGANQITILNPDRTVRSLLGQDYTTPVLLTLGARGHLGGFDPALFVSIDLRDGYVIFGLDLASVLAGSQRESREAGETREFLRGLD